MTATTDETRFLKAIVADPDDDTKRLVYADWLQENDRPRYAEVVRLQCELARIPLTVERSREMTAREWKGQAALAASGAKWTPAGNGSGPDRRGVAAWHRPNPEYDAAVDRAFAAWGRCEKELPAPAPYKKIERVPFDPAHPFRTSWAAPRRGAAAGESVVGWWRGMPRAVVADQATFLKHAKRWFKTCPFEAVWLYEKFPFNGRTWYPPTPDDRARERVRDMPYTIRFDAQHPVFGELPDDNWNDDGDGVFVGDNGAGFLHARATIDPRLFTLLPEPGRRTRYSAAYKTSDAAYLALSAACLAFGRDTGPAAW